MPVPNFIKGPSLIPPGRANPQATRWLGGQPAGPSRVQEYSTPLELSTFATFTGVSPGDTINSVIVTVNQFQTTTLMGPPTIELWDFSGSGTLIGSGLGTVTTSTANIDSLTFTGITYSMLATLRVRIYGHQGTALKGAVQNVNWVGLYASVTPAANTAILAHGAGAALNAAVATNTNPSAVLAAGTGSAQPPALALAPGAVLAAGTGAARGATATTAASVTAVAAAGTGAASLPAAAAGINAAAATGTGTARGATASTVTSGTGTAAVASGTGAAQGGTPAAGVNAAPAGGTGAAQSPSAVTSASVTAVLASGAGAALNPAPAAAASPAAVLAAAAGTGLGATASTSTSGTAGAVLASAAGTAAATPAAGVNAATAAGTGTARGPAPAPAAAAVLASAAGTALTTAFTYAPAGLASAAGTAQPAAAAAGAFYRLLDGTAGRPGSGSAGTQPPAAPTAYSGSYVAGLLFNVTSTAWLQGYWWWVPPGGDTGPVKFALWQQGTDYFNGLPVAGSTVTSATLTAGQWNYTPLSVPLLLSTAPTTAATCYVAAVGFAAATGIPVTQHQFGASDPYAAGITNGPLYAPPSGGSAAPGPQQPFSTAGTDPGVIQPSANDADDLLWVDVQVTSIPPAGASYRLWPNRPYSLGDGTGGGVSVTTGGYTMAVQFTLSQSCALGRIWFYSATTAFGGDPAVALPGRCAIWDMASQTVIAGTDNASPAWKKPDGTSGSAGDGWLYCDYSAAGVILTASTGYKAAVWYTGGSKWRTVVDAYWSSGNDGAAGITIGPLTAPNAASSTPGQNSWHGPNLAWHYPDTFSFPENDWIDVEVAPASASPAATVASGTGAAPGAAAASAASPAPAPATGTGTAQFPAPAIGVPAAAATGAGTAQGATITTAASPAAGLATGTGAALNATASTTTAGTANAALATGTGTASALPAAGVNAALASGAGTALNATVSTAAFTNAQAGLATGTGAALNAGLILAAIIPATPATGTGAAQATPAAGVRAPAATGTGTGQGASNAAAAIPASGTGAAQNATAALAYTAQAAAAHALAAALNAVGHAVEPFTVGTLAAADQPAAALTTATAPGGTTAGTLTASDQRTGGPGG